MRLSNVKILKRLSLNADLCIHSYWLSRLRQASHRKMIQSSALRIRLWRFKIWTCPFLKPWLPCLPWRPRIIFESVSWCFHGILTFFLMFYTLCVSGMSLSEPLSSPSPRLKRNASMHSKPLHRICKSSLLYFTLFDREHLARDP